ncbi:putative metalloprotease CJM1_0395 family protein [Aliikangiella sp. IMCC44359]|uniref:putative metalloprotease CJM1_0395 family protein n=1 Tax=Aliikangiella sp. IMCC44359 TaxID=3459125 RepID=UPI00403B158D
MLIASAPVVIPVTTANLPTEAVASEAAQKPPIPEAKSTTENTNLKNGTDSEEQAKASVDGGKKTQQRGKSDKEPHDSEKESQTAKEQQQQAIERQEIEQLKKADREVRAHEAAHANVGGQLAGAPQLSYKTGPDGKRYAVSGEVSISTSKVANNPQATLDKMDQVKRAALAPANPSAQDFKVAAIAGQIANQALSELNLEQREEQTLREAATKESGDETEDKTKTSSSESSSASSAKRTSLALNQKIVDSGALTNINIDTQVSFNV